MACNFVLSSGLQGTPADNGTWELLSSDATLPTNGILVNGLPQSLNVGTPLGTGLTVTIGVDDAETGEYVFRYTLNGGGLGCSAFADVTVNIVNGAVTGTSKTFTLCNTTNQWYNLYDLIRNGTINTNGSPVAGTQAISTTGTWSVSPSGLTSTNYQVGATAPFTNQFNPTGLALPANATVVFTYSVNNGGPLGCTNCRDTDTLTFNIVAAPNAGSNGSVTLCNATPA